MLWFSFHLAQQVRNIMADKAYHCVGVEPRRACDLLIHRSANVEDGLYVTCLDVAAEGFWYHRQKLTMMSMFSIPWLLLIYYRSISASQYYTVQESRAKKEECIKSMLKK